MSKHTPPPVVPAGIARRSVLLAGAALALGCPRDPTPPSPAPERERSPDPPDVELPVDTARFPWGVVVGDVQRTAALVRIRVVGEACTVRWAVFGEGVWAEREPIDLVRNGFTCRTTLLGLAPDDIVVVWAESGGVRSALTRFRTPPAASRVVRFGGSSCFAHFNEDLDNLTHVPPYDLDFFLLLGDTVYADGSVSRADYEAQWSRHLRRPAMGELFGATSMMATWDDHEVDNDWTLVPGLVNTIDSQTLRAASAVFAETIPMRLGPAGIYRRLLWGPDLEIFLLDARGERAEDRMVSEEQLTWLEQGLQSSSARFKLVLSSVHVTDHYGLLGEIQALDRWQGFPEQRARLVATLANVPGCLVITGDMHFGSVQRLDPEGPGYDVREVAVGPSGSRILDVVAISEIGDRGIPEHYDQILVDWSWSHFTLDPGTGEVVVLFIGNDGSTLAEQRFFL